ncbi:MAG: hypothetical protein KF716_29540 [Anaerolineae bacterium]|nr:hypothetical protein [Anaerolineae bacterium]
MMNSEIVRTGGARIGRANATWPFAKLRCTASELVLDVAILGKYTFAKGSVTRIEKYTSLPVIGQGVRLEHTIADYPARIIFWYLGNTQRLLEEIEAIGFLPQNASIG